VLPGETAPAGSKESSRVTLRHTWSRLDGSHPADRPFPNQHIVQFGWFRTELRAAYHPSSLWEVETVIPFDIKRIRARYELPGGEAFDNPLADLHHRDETLYGVADIQQWVGVKVREVLFPGGELGFAAGVSIPTGRTEGDPYKAGAAGKKHQHIQFGDGTFDPLLRLRYFVTPDWWGLSFSVGGQYPVYANDRGYRGPPTGDASVFFHAEGASWFSVGAGLVGLAQGRAYWGSEPDPNTGYSLAGLRLVPTFRPAEWLQISLSGTYALITRATGGADAFNLQWMAGISFSLIVP